MPNPSHTAPTGNRNVEDSILRVETHVSGLSAEFQRLQDAVGRLQKENLELRSHMSKVFEVPQDDALVSVPSKAGRCASLDDMGRVSGLQKIDSMDMVLDPFGMLAGPEPLRNAAAKETDVYLGARRKYNKTVSADVVVEESGWRLCCKQFLDVVPPIVILVNIMTLGVSADSPDFVLWSFLEIFYTSLYAAEFLIKLYMQGIREYFCGRDRAWDWFDFVCLTSSWVELCLSSVVANIGAVRVLKGMRLLRLLRAVRALRFRMFSELRAMLLGILSGMNVLGWALVLLFLSIYVLAVAMRTIAFDEDIPEFNNMVAASFTIFRCFTDGCSAYNGTPISEQLRERFGGLFVLGYVLVIMLVTIGIFNMIIAVFIEQVTASSYRRKQVELCVSEQATDSCIKQAVASLAMGRPVNSPGAEKFDVKRLSRDVQNGIAAIERNAEFDELADSGIQVDHKAFQRWMDDPDFEELLESADIDTSNKYELFDILDADFGGSLGLEEVVNGLMKLRGPVSKNDIVAIRMKVRYLARTMTECMSQMPQPRSER
eukprot:TRINITY_DN87201_c0_g1_i1.p1 TRINITY_DN87201_c0_g1~~TRINITY_DN87201_c0_g1_i1.p1  ORF type:complete len:544 (-),score=66.16 TRINITY_DN87201_c0_g1_i1:56-1687(-)